MKLYVRRQNKKKKKILFKIWMNRLPNIYIDSKYLVKILCSMHDFTATSFPDSLLWHNRPFLLGRFVFPLLSTFSRKLFFYRSQNYALMYSWPFENLKERILKSFMTWLAIGQQTAQGKKVLLSPSFDVFILYVTSAYRTIIDQFPYIKIWPKTIDLSTRFQGMTPTNSVVIPQSLCLGLCWILMSLNWSILNYLIPRFL